MRPLAIICAAIIATACHHQTAEDHNSHMADAAPAVRQSGTDVSALPASNAAAAARVAASPRRGEWVKVPFEASSKDTIMAWIVHPSNTRAKAPVVVVVHDIDGLSVWARGVADQAAAEGFIGISPDFTSRVRGAPSSVELPRDSVGKLMAMVNSGERSRIISAVAKYAMSRPNAEQRYGMVGYCWGGYVTCLVASVDPRFQAAVPVFGCGFLEAHSFWTPRHFQTMTQEARKKWTQLWDPASYLASARVPMFFVTGANNPYYPLDSYMRTYALVPGTKNISIQPKLRHGVLLDSREALAYFNEQFRDGPPPPKVGSVSIVDGKLRVEMASPVVLKSAELNYTIGPHSDNATRSWVQHPLSIDGPHLRGDIPPPDATAWFISVRDANNLMGSSEVVFK